jgi:hypothetical protein
MPENARLKVIPITQALEAENEELHRQLSGAEKEIRAWRTRYANLERDVEAEAREDPLWPLALRTFKYWQRAANHPRAEWTAPRFRMIKRLLEQPDGLERALRAISGCLSDDWRREKHLDLWEHIFESQKALEGCIAKCPKDWEPPKGYERS